MKKVKTSAEVRWIIKPLAINFVILLVFVTGSAFKAISYGDLKNPTKDSLLTDRNGFKSLFSTTFFNPAKPYIAQLNPKAVAFVQSYIETEGAYLEKMKFWGKPYFDVYDGILKQYELPLELKYLSVIESSLIPNSTSNAGAVGPWQIMADEARRMGLQIDGRRDERKNFYKSTYAAAKILKELHSQFDDWLLVIAAYNCGAGRVRQAIKNSGSSNFWDLQNYLPQETINHVKRFIGTHYIFEGNGGLTTMTASEISASKISVDAISNKELLNDAASGNTIVEVCGKFKSFIIAKNLGIVLSEFNKVNPNFDKLTAMGQLYRMRIPIDKVTLFINNKNAILNETIECLLKM